MRIHRNLLSAALVMTGAACQDVEIENEPPKAVIEVLIGGELVNTSMPIPFEGDPIELVLSGKKSSDEDGKIAKFAWRRTDVPASVRSGTADGGVEFGGDPSGGSQPTVVLGEGSYRFTLYVTDDDGALGTPVSVSFSIETPALYTGDPACVASYEGPNPDCEACVCAPAEMGGCFDLFDICINNADPGFSAACKAVLDCGVANACTGAPCYTAAFCMAEIDAAATYMGGPGVGACNDLAVMPAANPCRAVSLLSNCINLEAIPDPAREACGKLCAP